MEYRVTLRETGSGDYLASCAEPAAQARGLSPATALERLRAELRYQVELCPCSGVGETSIRLTVE